MRCRVPRTALLPQAGLFWLLALTACRAQSFSVEVAVGALPDSVRSLEVTATLNGQPAGGIAQVVDQNLQSFVVALPEGTSGELQLTVAGLGADRCQVAVGAGSLRIAGPGPQHLEVQLGEPEPGCRLQLRLVGKGTGTVALSDGTSQRDCQADGDVKVCEVTYPRDRRVTLRYSGNGLGGWFGACRGHAESCQVTIAAGVTQIQLDLLKKDQLGCRSDWCTEQWPVPTRANLYGIFGTDVTNVFAVGERGTVLHSDGIVWTALPSGGSARLSAVWSSGPDAMWAVGDGGAILRGQDLTKPGRSLRWEQSGSKNLYGIWGSSARELWAVGAGGAIRRWQGTAWESVVSPTVVALRGVWGSGPADVWAVGDQGVLLHWDGSSWTVVPGRARGALYGVGGSRPGAAWAVGEQGLIWSWDGGLWQPSPSGVTVPLYAVFSSPEAGPWAVGEAGTLLRRNGGIWDAAELGQGPAAPPRLQGIWGAGAFDVWAIGEGGTVLRYRP